MGRKIRVNRSSRELVLVSRPMNTITFADGALEGRSRSEEEVKWVYGKS